MAKNIVLIGYRCTGKTSVGKKLAEMLKIPFYDTDDLIKKETGAAVPELVVKNGWPFFRAKEREIIARLADLEGSVLALGGGAVGDARNLERLKRNGVFVWLRADTEVIAARMVRDPAGPEQRPSLTGSDPIAEIEDVLRQRLADYEKAADFMIDTSAIDIDAVAERIRERLENRLKKI